MPSLHYRDQPVNGVKDEVVHAHAMGVQVYTFLTLVVAGGEWPVSCPVCFTAGGRFPVTH
jgi:hypothetical protein